jgi:hypothetical protein
MRIFAFSDLRSDHVVAGFIVAEFNVRDSS